MCVCVCVSLCVCVCTHAHACMCVLDSSFGCLHTCAHVVLNDIHLTMKLYSVNFKLVLDGMCYQLPHLFTILSTKSNSGHTLHRVCACMCIQVQIVQQDCEVM